MEVQMSNVLSQLSSELAAMVERAGQSVVGVEGRRRFPASGVAFSDDGWVVTANHVLRRDEELSVILPDGRSMPARLAGRDPGTDLALLKVEETGLKAAAWEKEDGVRVGHLVAAVGRPGPDVQATLGMVSALGGSWRTPAGGSVDRYLQSDVVMYPGFSGGPLVGAEGRVIGLNSSALVRGVSIALPGITVRRVVESLKAHGRVRRGYLGVGTQPARLPAASAEKLGQTTGLLVMSVEPGSPAEKAGLVLGDTLLVLQDQTLQDMDDLLHFLTGDVIGRSAPLRILRGGQVQDLTITIGERG
jgi:S1-C subfamily serine protease